MHILPQTRIVFLQVRVRVNGKEAYIYETFTLYGIVNEKKQIT